MITTKRGDGGETDCGGKRIDKDDLLVETIGEIDELQSVLEIIDGDKEIIRDLGVIMGDLGTGKKFSIFNFQFSIEKMEEEIEKNKINLNKFIIFKKKKAKEMNWARTVCRRIERRVVTLSKRQQIDENILKYFNRLSDYLFVLALKNN
ncbi:MAG: ATP:cob(I)alamin adenosyltransferase [Candidatus Shapirobacteria bacterium]|jgi:cob(I)alamin adenosyltransferase|nr:ATP:cob(I)alamin adenosyltransferase [Candidatus Shapirobacteria bacterium]